jgi:hypothetical protein
MPGMTVLRTCVDEAGNETEYKELLYLPYSSLKKDEQFMARWGFRQTREGRWVHNV